MGNFSATADKLICHTDLNFDCKDGEIIPILHPPKTL